MIFAPKTLPPIKKLNKTKRCIRQFCRVQRFNTITINHQGKTICFGCYLCNIIFIRLCLMVLRLPNQLLQRHIQMLRLDGL